MGNAYGTSKKVFVKDVIRKDIRWYRFADAFANYMGVEDTDVGIRLTAGYIACLGENEEKQTKFIIDYESVKDIELTYFYNYFGNRFKNHTLNCLHLLKLEKLIEGRIVNQAFVADDGNVWIPVNSYYFEISILETEISGEYLDNTQFVDLSEYCPNEFTSEPTTAYLSQLSPDHYPYMYQESSFDGLKTKRTDDELTEYNDVYDATCLVECKYNEIVYSHTKQKIGLNEKITDRTVGSGSIKRYRNKYYLDTIYHCTGKTFNKSQRKPNYQSINPNFEIVSIKLIHPWLPHGYEFEDVNPSISFNNEDDAYWDYPVLHEIVGANAISALERRNVPEYEMNKESQDDDLGRVYTTGFPNIKGFSYLRSLIKTTSVSYGLLYPIQDYLESGSVLADINFVTTRKRKPLPSLLTSTRVAYHDGKCTYGFSGGDAYSPLLNKSIGKQHGCVRLFNVDLCMTTLYPYISIDDVKKVNDRTGNEKEGKMVQKSFNDMFLYRFSCLSVLRGIKNFGLKFIIDAVWYYVSKCIATIIYYGIGFAIWYLGMIEGFINTFMCIPFIARIVIIVIGYLRGLLTNIQALANAYK